MTREVCLQMGLGFEKEGRRHFVSPKPTAEEIETMRERILENYPLGELSENETIIFTSSWGHLQAGDWLQVRTIIDACDPLNIPVEMVYREANDFSEIPSFAEKLQLVLRQPVLTVAETSVPEAGLGLR